MCLKNSLLAFAALIAAGASYGVFAGAAAPRIVGDYRMRVEAGDPPRVTIEADVDSADGRLVMATGGGIDQLPNQWATFVVDLRATDAHGRRLPLEAVGAEGWRVGGSYRGRVYLAYRIDLHYATEPWPAGNEQSGLWAHDALYSVTKPLFVAGSGDGARRVRFELPLGWRVSTPWEPEAPSSEAFMAASRADLTENSLVIGRQFEKRFEHGPFKITLALLGELAGQAELLSAALDAVARHANRVFPRTPPARYLVTIFHAAQSDGEAFTSSSAFTTPTTPTLGNVMSWGNTLAHETYHVWIGGPIRGSEDDVWEWFDEGFTDYYADQALVQSGFVDAAMYLRKAEKVMGRYAYYTVASVYERQNAFEASRNKGRNRFGVYDGGWATAFCLDGLIQEKSGGARALDDAMRTLHERYALHDRPFTRAEFVEAMSEAAGADLGDFFRRYVDGQEPLPLADCLDRAGLEGAFQDYAADVWITPLAAPTETQQRIFRRITEGPPAP